MAHNISQVNGKDEMAYVGEKPWHGLGTHLGDSEVTSAEIMKAAGLDYQIDTRAVYTKIGRKMVEVPNRAAIVRTDTGNVFGIQSDRWEPVQNSDSFAFFDSVVGEGQAVYHTAGALGAGEKVWILAKLPGEMQIAGDEVIRYVLLMNGHDGTTPFTFQMTPVRVVCENTLNIALRTGESDKVYRQLHRRGINARLSADDAASIIGLAGTYYEVFADQANALAQVKMTKDAVADFVGQLFPYPALPAPHQQLALPAPDLSQYTDLGAGFKASITNITNKREEVMELIYAGKGNDRKGVKGTKWAAFNGVAEYADYKRGKNETRHESLLIGFGRDLKQQAWDILTN